MQINYKSTRDNKCETTGAKNTIEQKVSQSSKNAAKTTRMSGEGQYREQAKKQWEKLDTEGHKIINDLIVADKDRTIWPENTEPKFTRRKV